MSSPGAPTLVLVPTPGERRRLEALGGLGRGRGLVETVGFGPVAAAARTAALLARLAPRRALLLGIAGTYDEERLPVGAARAFGAVLVDGIGAGEGTGGTPPSAMGLAQWDGSGDGAQDGGPVIHERLPLAAAGPGAPELLTVCAASGDRAMAARRGERFPTALAEDMEAFGAALACALAGVPLAVVRGASNRAGDRDHAGWRVDEALAAARARALELLEAGEAWA